MEKTHKLYTAIAWFFSVYAVWAILLNTNEEEMTGHMRDISQWSFFGLLQGRMFEFTRVEMVVSAISILMMAVLAWTVRGDHLQRSIASRSDQEYISG
jgi:hypothetical protein